MKKIGDLAKKISGAFDSDGPDSTSTTNSKPSETIGSLPPTTGPGSATGMPPSESGVASPQSPAQPTALPRTLNEALQQSTRPWEERGLCQSSDLDRLFVLLEADYGALWGSRFVDARQVAVVKARWLERLQAAHITSQAVDKASDVLTDYHPDRPPSLGQFLKVCRIVGERRRVPRLGRPNRSIYAMTQLKQLLGKYGRKRDG